MAVAVSTRLLAAEVRVLFQAIHVGFVVDRMALGQFFFPSTSVVSCLYHTTMLHTHSFNYYLLTPWSTVLLEKLIGSAASQ